MSDHEQKARELLRQLGLFPVDGVGTARLAKLREALRQAVAEERERCAKACGDSALLARSSAAMAYSANDARESLAEADALEEVARRIREGG